MSGNHARKAQAIRNVMAIMSKQSGPQRFTSQTKLISAAPTKCQFEFKVAERDLNMFGTLHGGISATIVDVLTNLTLIDGKELDGQSNIEKSLGVSTELNISYLGKATEGEIVLFETELIKSGRNLSFLNCVGSVKDSEPEKVVVAGRHTLVKI